MKEKQNNNVTTHSFNSFSFNFKVLFISIVNSSKCLFTVHGLKLLGCQKSHYPFLHRKISYDFSENIVFAFFSSGDWQTELCEFGIQFIFYIWILQPSGVWSQQETTWTWNHHGDLQEWHDEDHVKLTHQKKILKYHQHSGNVTCIGSLPWFLFLPLLDSLKSYKVPAPFLFFLIPCCICAED